MHYTDLIFDLYGTLVDIHTEENDTVWDKTALYFGFYGALYTGNELKENFYSLLSKRKAKAGQAYECFPDIPFEQIMADLFRTRNVSKKANELGFHAAQLFRILSIEYLRVYPHVQEGLSMLRAHGYKLWLLSNAQRSFTAYELQALGLDGMFDGIYISSDYGCRKPDLRFFQALLKEQQLDPAKCLMIGNDRQTDIAGASAAGMDTLYMHTALTPSNQLPANPALDPSLNSTVFLETSKINHYEFEGDDWEKLSKLLCELANYF